jgi:hypothetical protein
VFSCDKLLYRKGIAPSVIMHLTTVTVLHVLSHFALSQKKRKKSKKTVRKNLSSNRVKYCDTLLSDVQVGGERKTNF